MAKAAPFARILGRMEQGIAVLAVKSSMKRPQSPVTSWFRSWSDKALHSAAREFIEQRLHGTCNDVTASSELFERHAIWVCVKEFHVIRSVALRLSDAEVMQIPSITMNKFAITDPGNGRGA